MKSKFNRRDFLKFVASSMVVGYSLPISKQLSAFTPGNRLSIDTYPNILVLVFDALSALNMSLYGYPRKTTPNIDRLASRAIVYHRHYASGSFTTSGTASLLTGVYPWSHRALNSRSRARSEYANKNLFSLIGSDYFRCAHTQNNLVTQLLDQFKDHIQDLFKATETGLSSGSVAEKRFWNDFNAAYQSESILLGYYHQLPSLLLSSAFSKLRGYRINRIVQDQLGELFPRGIPQTGNHMYFLLEDTVKWISNKTNQIQEPYLAYVHLWPPHDPYRTRLEFIDVFLDDWNPPQKESHVFSQGHSDALLRENQRQYDEYIAYVDAEFGQLYETLDKSGILNNTIVILTSDHGEMFERGIYGHLTPVLFEPLIKVPLLVFTPTQKNRRDIFTPTSSSDVLPTICEMTGKSIPEWVEGHVLPAFNKAPIERNVFAMDSKHISQYSPFDKGSIAIIRDHFKLIQYSGYESITNFYELYDLENDPEEITNIYHKKTNVAKFLKNEISNKLDQINQKIY